MKTLVPLSGYLWLFMILISCSESTNPSEAGVSSSDMESQISSVPQSAGSSSSQEIVAHRSSSLRNLSSSQGVSHGTMIDSRDNQEYRTVKIGSQTWMAENLNFEFDKVGDLLRPSCFQDTLSLCEKSGVLYTWVVAMNVLHDCYDFDCQNQVDSVHQGICPQGWHIPSKADWETLVKFVGSGAALKAVVPGSDLWNDPMFHDQDPYGFSALPAGRYLHNSKSWASRDLGAYFWSTEEQSSSDGAFSWAKYRSLFEDAVDFYNYTNIKWDFLSVRCMQDM